MCQCHRCWMHSDLKPSEETPLVAMALAYCADKAGLNDGQPVYSCASPVELSDHLMASPKVRMLSFSGSTNVGKKVLQICWRTPEENCILNLVAMLLFYCFRRCRPRPSNYLVQRGARFYNNGQICIALTEYSYTKTSTIALWNSTKKKSKRSKQVTDLTNDKYRTAD